MISRRRWIAAAFAFLALAVFCSFAVAEYHELKEPHLVVKDYSEADYKALKAVLERSDCKFLGGAELNAASSLRYGGDTTALNRFIAALSLCPRLTVQSPGARSSRTPASAARCASVRRARGETPPMAS